MRITRKMEADVIAAWHDLNVRYEMCSTKTIWVQTTGDGTLNIAIQLDIPKERVRSILSSYYMSTLPEEYRPADHLSYPEQDLLIAQQLLQSDDFDVSGVFRRPEPRPVGGVYFETATGRQRLRRIESSSTLRVRLARWVVNYFQNFLQFPTALQS